MLSELVITKLPLYHKYSKFKAPSWNRHDLRMTNKIDGLINWFAGKQKKKGFQFTLNNIQRLRQRNHYRNIPKLQFNLESTAEMLKIENILSIVDTNIIIIIDIVFVFRFT